MPGINQATVGDGYTATATVQDVFTSTGGWFSVATQPVVLQLQWGPNASGSRWSDEQTLGAGAFGTIPPGCTGIRFRNLVAGQAATVTAYIGSGGAPPDPGSNVWPEPALAISALGDITTSGKSPTQTLLTLAGGTYNIPAGCVAILVECIAPGGAGGGAAVTGVGQVAIGGGGGGGGYAASFIGSPAASYAYAVGAAGVGAAGAGGGNGENASFGTGPLVLANGGAGGAVGTALASATQTGGQGGAGGGAGGGSGAIGNVQLRGSNGDYGAQLGSGIVGGIGGTAARGGSGGSAIFNVSAGGSPGGQYGGGGSGAVNGANQGAKAGGNGAAGVIIVTEFY